LKLDWFEQLTEKQDYDHVKRILSLVNECVTDIENSDSYDPYDNSEYDDDYSCPIGLYAVLLGDYSRLNLYWESDRGVVGISDFESLMTNRTYFELWSALDLNAQIKFIDWGVHFTFDMSDIFKEDTPIEKLLSNQAYSSELCRYLQQKEILRVLSNQLDSKTSDESLTNDIVIVRNRICALESILDYLITKTEINYAVRDEKIKLEERNRILSNLSHSIKNMLKAVIGPLQTLREEIPEKAAIIDNAIKGANLIREIVNAINLSFKTTIDELQWDVLNPGKESMSLQDMIADSLKYSIGNMFDFRYFPVYAENYFLRKLSKADFERIQLEWNQAQQSIDAVRDFCDKQLFKLELDLDDSRDYHVGNEKSSAIKLMILFQEMIFNAVKYTSFMPLDERIVHLSLTRHDAKLRLLVKNSYSGKVRAKTTGVGKLVIENFAKVLGCEPKIIAEGKYYSIEMEFDDIWRKDA